MKIAITSTGNTLSASLDRRFGRCAWFVIYDKESGGIEFLPNPNRDADEGAGPASVKLIAGKGVSKIVSGEFGLKIKPLLDSLKIQMIALKDQEKSVSEIIEMLNH
jgi:predicted Fe-Mo cluster-binding NifX family protein